MIDSDANNETDDQHAIAYAFLSKDVFEVEEITFNKTHSVGDVDAQMSEAVRIVKLCGFYPQLPRFKEANGNLAEILPHIHNEAFDGKEAIDLIVKRPKSNRSIVHKH